MNLLPILKCLQPDSAIDAVIDRTGVHSYGDLFRKFHDWCGLLQREGLGPHAVASIEGDYGADYIAAMLALADAGAVLVPISGDSAPHRAEFLEAAEVEWRVHPESRTLTRTAVSRSHAYYVELEARNSPGLVLFTSGSTGRNKAAVHDLDRLLRKFAVAKRRLRTLVFLQPDHIGGVNTLFYTLSNNGAVVIPEERHPAHICDLIDRHQVELLPTSPTFLNLLLLAFDPSRHSLASLKHITYGTEPMPQTTLERVRTAFPNARLQQTYGLTEVGILRSRSRDDGSLWVQLGGEGFDLRVIDGRLWIKAESSMLGYLNAPSPFSPDGYLDTGDRVEVEGEWVRIIGRESDIINVGGSKVFPAEVENVILQLPNVDDVLVRGESHPLTGQIVVAQVRLEHPEPARDFIARLRQFCAGRLSSFKVPARVLITEDSLHGARFKKQRRALTV